MDRLILANATLVDVDRGPLPGATIAITGDRIESVDFDRHDLPHDAVVHDLRGHSVMAGMYVCHYHASYNGVGGGASLPVGMEASPALQTLRATRHLGLALDAGFTGVISAGAPHAIDAALKTAVDEGTIRGPRIMAGSRDVSTTGHSVDTGNPWYWGMTDPPSTVRCDGPDEFRRAVREEVKRGAEIIKIFLTTGHVAMAANGRMEMTRPELQAAIEAAHDRGVLVRAHVANRDAILTAIELGVDVIDHGDGLDERCIERLVETGTFLVPSMLFPHRLSQLMQGRFSDMLKADVAQVREILPRANEAGVKIVLGDDYGAIGLDHGLYADEPHYYVEEVGIPALDVLRWATVNGAQLMRRGHELGTIAPGMLADLVIVDGEPISDIGVLRDAGRILAVIKDGRFERDRLGPPSADPSTIRSLHPRVKVSA